MHGRLVVSAFALMAAAWTAPAFADVISGSFAGVVTSGSFFTASGPTDVAGAAVTGSFDVSSLAGLGSSGPTSFVLPYGEISYSFTIASIGQTFSFGVTPQPAGIVGGLALSNSSTQQTLTLNAELGGIDASTILTLSGPAGSLFSPGNLFNTLHIGPGVTIETPLSLSVAQAVLATIQVTGQSFPGLPVPEAPSWTILAFGVAAMGVVRWRLTALERQCRADPGWLDRLGLAVMSTGVGMDRAVGPFSAMPARRG